MATEVPSRAVPGFRAWIGGKPLSFSTIQEKLEALAEAWEEQHAGRSVLSLNHIAYHQIIGMGEAAIPLLIERVRNGEAHWIYALKCISGEQAETPEMQGDADRVIEAWVEWGRRWVDDGRFQQQTLANQAVH
jgi:hypothetical protein